MLIELHGSNAEHDEAKLTSFLDEVMASGAVVTTTRDVDRAKILRTKKAKE